MKLFVLIDFSSGIKFYSCICCNPSLGLITKAKGLQGCGPRLSSGDAFLCPGNAKECEGKNLHTPK